LSCAGDNPVYLLKDGHRIKLVKTSGDDKNDNEVSYHIKQQKWFAPVENELFFKADFSSIEGPFLYQILFDKGEKSVEVSTGGAGKCDLYFIVPAGKFITGIIIDPADKIKPPVLGKIEQVAQDSYFSGIKSKDEKYILSDTVSKEIREGRDVYSYSVPDSKSSCREIFLDFNYFPEGDDEKIDIFLTGKEGETLSLNYTPVRGRTNNIVLNSRMIDLIPEKFEVSGEKSSINIQKLYSDSESCSACITAPFTPLKAGFGAILLSAKTNWRFDDYELYSWTCFPDFLIIDTIDYTFQAKMFKRLAFYVEKPGSIGKILTDEDIKDLHGWNAHDYKAEDLTSFFNKVENLDFELNKEEELLKEILIVNNVIGERDGQYFPGNGGILSISRESSGYLRRIFITHEGYHGVFFSSEEFRKKCKIIWNEVEPELKEFWELFFQYKNYNTNDSYLLVNEFMAYNLQQPPDRVIPYYFDYIIPLLIKKYPDRGDFFKMIADTKKERFIYFAEKLGAALGEVTSLPAGSLILLNKNRDS
jgi:hypothetical protein